MSATDSTRREFSSTALRSLLTFSLFDTLLVHDAFGAEVRATTETWVRELDDLSRSVKDETLRQEEWQKLVERLLARVDLPDLLRSVDFETLRKRVKYPERGELSLRFRFREIAGIPTKRVFGQQIFALKEGHSVIPHGHNNMATAFLILDGTLHGRHYDRLEDQKDHLILKPTIDGKFKPGEFSTVTDYKDNVHWFTAESREAFIFNFHVLGLNPRTTEPKRRTGRVYVDPNGEALAGGRIRARRIGYREANELYGRRDPKASPKSSLTPKPPPPPTREDS